MTLSVYVIGEIAGIATIVHRNRYRNVSFGMLRV
jgi:hypothetical protein